MSKLIALVATAVVVDGKRTVIQPGEALPTLTSHDERELLASGAAENLEDTAALEKKAARDEAEAHAAFDEERAKVQEKQASTEANPADDPATPAKAKAAGKK